MNAKVISKEKNTVKFTFNVSAEKFEEGMKYAYEKNKKHISIPGFRKGKAPRKMIEAAYGEAIMMMLLTLFLTQNILQQLRNLTLTLYQNLKSIHSLSAKKTALYLKQK